MAHRAESSAFFADEFFLFLATRFPVMCASDEFAFMPRAEASLAHLNRLDDLTAPSITEAVDRVREYRSLFLRRAAGAGTLEEEIDFTLLSLCAGAFLLAFADAEAHRRNPLLYLRIAFVGLDHAITKPAASEQERADSVLSRLSGIPGLLRTGMRNLSAVDPSRKTAVQALADDASRWLEALFRPLCDMAQKDLSPVFEEVKTEMAAFCAAARKAPDAPREAADREKVERVLLEHYGCNRSLSEIFELGSASFEENRALVQKLAGRIEPGAPWKKVYHEYLPDVAGSGDLFEIYEKEIEKLAAYFRDSGFPVDPAARMRLSETPLYQVSSHGSAFFGAALTAHPEEISIFFINPDLGRGGTAAENDLLRKRILREYRYLTGHETVPGHHLLDCVRRGLENPVRRQIESPLYYEGWATYAEFLLEEFGYVTDPMEILVDRKRRLWRAARCMIDAGMALGELDAAQAAGLLVEAGYAETEAARQVARFGLNPGYQLCYTLGSWELSRIRSELGGGIEPGRFFHLLLRQGQIPFHLLERALGQELDQESGRKSGRKTGLGMEPYIRDTLS